MAYSIQVYKFNTSKNSKEVKNILEKIKKKQDKNDYYQLRNIDESKGIVVFSMTINKNYETLYYDITLKPKNNFLIVQGRGDGRSIINKFLAKMIEDDSLYNVVSEYRLSVRQSLQLFRKITNEHNSNIITHLKVQFEPEFGYEYAKETYTELSYKFIDNRCASKHRDFEELHKNGKRMYMSMRLVECAGIVSESSNSSSRIDMKPDCSFRMYSDVPHKNWNEFCFKILDFL
ncbi:MAG: hypothetical protein IIC67_10115 [Thaumarchaeota archaeon]|nr:hypothetical protein [Nitrososphaerota archaeon]